MGLILLTIVTPEKQLLSEEVTMVNIPTTEGVIGVLPGHVPLYAQMKSGELMYKKDDLETYYAIHGGFVEVEPDQVRILAHDATRAEDLDEAVIEEARRKAQEAMDAKISDEEFVVAEAAMRRALLELRVASRKRR